MAIGDVLRTTFRLITTHNVLIENTFFSQITGIVEPTDAEILSSHEDWMEQIYAYLAPWMDNSLGQGSHQVDVVELAGVYNPNPVLNTSKVVTVRNVGYINPAFNPTQAGEQYNAIATGVATAKTATPGVRGRKGFGGFTEGGLAEGVFNGSNLTALANAAVEWIQGPPAIDLSIFASGVLSHSLGEFAPFTGSGSVTNNPGTAIRRRIGRGS